MADYEEYEDYGEEMELEEEKPTGIQRLVEYADLVNIAEELDEQDLLEIGNRVVEDYETDEDSREDWLKRNENAIKLAKQVVEEKSWPWPNASNIKYPLITTAAIHFNARAYPAIVNGTKVVKGQVIGDDPQGQKFDRAERVGEHMSYQLTEEMEEWEEETDQLTTILPIVGNVFRKTYFCPTRKRNVSQLVRAEDFTYHYEKKFDVALRHTERFELYPQDIIERQRMGLFRDVDLGIDGDIEDETPQEFLEQHCWIDLDDDDYKEPYIVLVHYESRKVVRIVARYDLDEITVRYRGEVGKVKDFKQQVQQALQQRMQMIQAYEMEAGQYMQQGMVPPPMPSLGPLPEFNLEESEIIKIDPVKYYTKYGFIPSFDGGGYDVGLGQLLGPLGDSINTILNQMVDAGSLANLQGGFISRGLKVRKGQISTAPNEWITVDNQTGGSIRDSVVPWNFKGPAPVLLNLLTFLIDAAQDISSVKDSVTGESAGANESPTTYLTRVSEGLKVFSAIYKRVHRSLKQEFRKLYRLNRLYLPDESYYTVLDNQKAIKQQDYAGDDVDVIPISDPSIATTTQKAAKAQAVFQVGVNNKRYDQYELHKMLMEAIEVDGVDRVLLKDEDIPPDPPNPAVIELQGKLEKMGAETAKIAAETEKTKAETIQTYNDIQATVAQLQQSFEKLNVEKLGKMLDFYSKVVTEQENYDLYKKVKNEQSGVRAGTTDSGRVPRVEIPQNNPEGSVPPGS